MKLQRNSWTVSLGVSQSSVHPVLRGFISLWSYLRMKTCERWLARTDTTESISQINSSVVVCVCAPFQQLLSETAGRVCVGVAGSMLQTLVQIDMQLDG